MKAPISFIVASILLCTTLPAQDVIFRDTFETGDPLSWTLIAGEGPSAASCVDGTPLTGSLEGNLAPAPSGIQDEVACVEIRNDQGTARDEVAFAGIPLPRQLGLTDPSELAVVGPNRRRLAAQFDVLSRWGGPVDDTALPIRWLEVSVEARLGASETASYSLRRYQSLPAVNDPWAVSVTPQGARFAVDTGLATFTIDPANPALIQAISVDLDDDGQGRVPIYTHGAGAGPRLVFDPGGGAVVLDTTDPARVVVDPGSFELVETGPVKAVVKLDGHFSAPGGTSLCTPVGVTPYERFGYSVILTVFRGRRDFALELDVRNECSDAFGDSWTDEAITVEEASWRLPFSGSAPVTRFYAGQGAVTSTAANPVRVEQRKGAGNPWQRRARVLAGGVSVENAQAFSRPLVALENAEVVVAATMPWMRFREPQALELDGQTLELAVIGEPLVVGEGKGLWNFARISVQPTQLAAAGPGGLAGHLDRERQELIMALERGLLVAAPRSHIDSSRLFAGLGTDAPSPIKSAYVATINALHDDTVAPGGQWDRAKTYGSQLWPDVQFDQWSIDAPQDPSDNSGAMNYWNPSGAELFELLRTGDPRWLWDFAWPQSLLQMHSAYLNIGDQDHGNRSGVAVTSGGAGEGQWHRSAFGSDDYTYNGGLQLAYALRPSPGMRDRFAQAGRMLVGRYSVPQALREPFVNEVDVSRQVIQHFEMLMNCAEFVPGADGQACHDRLLALVDELAHDNLRAGLMCEGDVPSPSLCSQPQKFMHNAMMYPFFHRYLLNYGDVEGRIQDALVADLVNYYNFGMSKQADGVSIDVVNDWAALLECSLTAGGTQIGSCIWIATGDGDLLWHNKPHSVALMLMAHELDPTVGLCAVAKAALDDPAMIVGWNDYLGNDPGWWKGAAQMMQSMVFGVGIYDRCVDP